MAGGAGSVWRALWLAQAPRLQLKSGGLTQVEIHQIHVPNYYPSSLRISSLYDFGGRLSIRCLLRLSLVRHLIWSRFPPFSH